MWNKSRTPIGVDVGARCVRLVQLERRGQQYAAFAAAQQVLPGDLKPGDEHQRAVGEAIRRMLEQDSFQGRRCVSCLPAAGVQYKNLRLPRMPDDELAQAVQWEATDRLHLSGDAMAMQFFDAGEVRQGDEARREVILLAASHRLVESHTQSLVDAGLDPIVVDVVPAALRRCMETLPAQAAADAGDKPVRVVMDVGSSSTKLLITRGDELVFFKLMPVGGQRFDESAAEALRLPVREAGDLRRGLIQGDIDPGSRERVLAEVSTAIRPHVVEMGRELTLCLRYYGVTFRGHRPDEVVLVGGEATMPGLAEMLADCAGVTVRPIDPLGGIDVSSITELVPGLATRVGWATAVGLALRPQRLALPGAAA